MEWKIYRRWKVFLAQIFDFENDFPLKGIFFPPVVDFSFFFLFGKSIATKLFDRAKKKCVWEIEAKNSIEIFWGKALEGYLFNLKK